jgi:ferredoxin-type protein NapH
MRGFFQSLKVLLGAEPRKQKRDEFSPEAQQMHAHKNTPEQRKERIKLIREELAEPSPSFTHSSFKWRKWRWASIILINLMFVVSFHYDVQLVEGALTASRFVGFHMADLNSALQITLAHKEIVVNLVIGTVTVGILWWLVGGRAFCSWACPYHLVAEWAEMMHIWLANKGWIKDHPLDRRMRTVLYVVFALLALVTGYTVFESISVVGILSRALIYGVGVAMTWVAVMLLIEIFLVRRFWCRYVCPIGMTYGFLGTVSPLVVEYTLPDCLHEGECRKVCMVPHVLEMTKKNRAEDVALSLGADCTRCGMCLEVCPTGALNFKLRGTGGLL